MVTPLAFPGFRIGQSTDARVRTGVTVILPDAPAPCAVDVRGGGPGTRETDALAQGRLIDSVHAVVLAGGSVYGLAAADGVCAWLGAKGTGFLMGTGVPPSPIVPGAILFDNANGGDKDWGMQPPFRALGIAACEAATHTVTEGASGAGTGAMAGLYPGGIGLATERAGDAPDSPQITAIIAANPIGSPYLPGTICPHAWGYERDGEFSGVRPPADYVWQPPTDTKLARLTGVGQPSPTQSTVIGALITDAALPKDALARIATTAHDGIALAVQPSHTPLDGDTLFAISVGHVPCQGHLARTHLGAAATRAVARALMRGVRFAGPQDS